MNKEEPINNDKLWDQLEQLIQLEVTKLKKLSHIIQSWCSQVTRSAHISELPVNVLDPLDC